MVHLKITSKKPKNPPHRLQSQGMQVNPLKLFWEKDKTEYLGFILNQKDIKPQPKKISQILEIDPLKNKKQLRQFIGMINYYKDMYKQHTTILQPLTSIVGKKAEWVWGESQQEAFNKIMVMAKEATLYFPDFTKNFDVYTDASDSQMGGVVMQSGEPLTFFTQIQLSVSQIHNYQTGTSHYHGNNQVVSIDASTPTRQNLDQP